MKRTMVGLIAASTALFASACGSVDFQATQVATVVTESHGVGFDELGRGLVGAGDGGLCVFAGELGMVGEMDVPGQDRVLDMWGARAIVAGDDGHLAFPDRHQVSELPLADAGTPVAARLTSRGNLAAIQQGDTCIVTSTGEHLADVPGTCEDLAVDRLTGQAWILVDGDVYEVTAGQAVALDLHADAIAWDGMAGDLWLADGQRVTRVSLDSGDTQDIDLGHDVLDIEPAGQAWTGVIVALFKARDSVVHVRPDGTTGMSLTPDRPAVGVTTNFEGTFLGVEGQTQVELYELVRPGERRRRVRQSLATGGMGGVVMYD